MKNDTASVALVNDIHRARASSLKWIASMETYYERTTIWRESAASDLAVFPGMALPGTYNSAMCLSLIGNGSDLKPSRRRALTEWIMRQRRADGHWWLRNMRETDTYKKPDANETRSYLTGHITNYTLGALEALDHTPLPEPAFAYQFLDLDTLGDWMERRDWDDPWQEGNNIVNLASFLLLLADGTDEKIAISAKNALNWLIDWHERETNPETGFWGNDQTSPAGRLHAMAGATHNFHIFFRLDRPVPHLDKSVDYCLTQRPTVVSACIDADLVDILSNAVCVSDYRQNEIIDWLAEIGAALLRFQNSDGGFADQAEGMRRFDGWVRGYEEPQGISCGFGTFFRWIALAMITRVLDPDDHSWTFRKMIGLGYFRHG
jgi:hypothetical protein